MATAQMLIITGLSGSGKSLVHSCFEDMGFYCVDNLPIGLIGKFFELVESSEDVTRVAVVTDVRERNFLRDFVSSYTALKKRFPVELLFLEASETVLIQRFSETRRPHPLSAQGPLQEVLRLEREKLQTARDLADHIIDTSRFHVHELRDYIRRKFTEGPRQAMLVSVVSFGFKHGIPHDVDLLFDVRFLPNPHFVSDLRGLTGLDEDVRDYVLRSPETRDFLEHLNGFMRYLLPHYVKEGKSYLTIGVGCTGGKHRSVVIARELAQALEGGGYGLTTRHRDLERA